MSIKKNKLKREITSKQEIDILENKIKKKEIQLKKFKQDGKKVKKNLLKRKIN